MLPNADDLHALTTDLSSELFNCTAGCQYFTSCSPVYLIASDQAEILSCPKHYHVHQKLGFHTYPDQIMNCSSLLVGRLLRLIYLCFSLIFGGQIDPNKPSSLL